MSMEGQPSEEVLALRAEIQRLTQRLESSELNGADVAQARNDRVVYLPSERKVKKFYGRPRNHQDISVEDWIDEIQASIRSRPMTPQQQADFVISNLEGNAKKEIKLRQIGNDAEAIFIVLSSVFGDGVLSVSANHLQKQFFLRQQNANETLREYSYELKRLFDRIKLKSPEVSNSENKTLCDQFAENVRDFSLKKELKRVLRDNPDINFIELREKAVRWSDEDLPAKSKGHVTLRFFTFIHFM